MKKLESNMREIEMDGLTWGASKLVPLAFGIKKLQVNLVVEDEKVSIDDLQAQIENDEDHVQSTDVVSNLLINDSEHVLNNIHHFRLLCRNCRERGINANTCYHGYQSILASFRHFPSIDYTRCIDFAPMPYLEHFYSCYHLLYETKRFFGIRGKIDQIPHIPLCL